MYGMSFRHSTALFTWLYHIPFTLQYTNYEYGELYDYTEGELTTDTPPAERSKTEVTPD